MPSPSGANQDNVRRPQSEPNSSAPHVRAAESRDADRLAEINLLTWRDAYAGLVPNAYLETLDVATLRDRWLARLEEPGDRKTFLAEIDGQVATYAIVGGYRVQQDAEPEDTTGWGELYAIYTHPDLQGRGAGRAVHDSALDTLHSRGHQIAALWVLRDNLKTRRWYDARGWRADGATSEWLGAGVPLLEVRLTRRTNG